MQIITIRSWAIILQFRYFQYNTINLESFKYVHCTLYIIKRIYTVKPQRGNIALKMRMLNATTNWKIAITYQFSPSFVHAPPSHLQLHPIPLAITGTKAKPVYQIAYISLDIKHVSPYIIGIRTRLLQRENSADCIYFTYMKCTITFMIKIIGCL